MAWCFTAAPHWTMCWSTHVGFVSAMDWCPNGLWHLPLKPASGVVFYSSTTLHSLLTFSCLFCFSDGLWCPSWTSQWGGVLQQHHTGLCADLLMSVLFRQWTVVPQWTLAPPPPSPVSQPVGWCFTAASHCTLCWPSHVCFVSAMDFDTPPEPANGVVFYSSTTLYSVLTYSCLFCLSDGLWCPSWTSQWGGVLQQYHTGLCADLLVSVLFQRWTVVPLLNQPMAWCFTAAPHWTLWRPTHVVVVSSWRGLPSGDVWAVGCGLETILSAMVSSRLLPSSIWSDHKHQCGFPATITLCLCVSVPQAIRPCLWWRVCMGYLMCFSSSFFF